MSLPKEECRRQPMSSLSTHVVNEDVMMDATSANSEFAMLLYVIGCKLSKEETKAVVYLIQDIITRSEAEKIQHAVNAFNLLQYRDRIHYTRPGFLCDVLREVGRNDLCLLVREYERNVTRIPSRLQTSSDHHAKESEKQFRRRYYSRVRLKRLADKLTRNDLQSMLAICRDIFPLSYQEKIDSPLDLFYVLEEYGHLSPEDASILEKLLESKKHLLKNFESSEGMAAQTNSSATQCQNHPNPKVGPSNFQLLLVHIGESLSHQEVEHLKTFQPQCSLATHDVVTGPELMAHWQELDLISPLKTRFLSNALQTIGRRLLCHELSAYSQDSEQHNIGKQATNSKFRGAELTPKHPLSSQGCRFDCACQRSARELYEARMGIGKQPSFPTRQPPSYERDRPRLENHLMPSSSKQHPREFVLDVETYDHHRETQFDDGHSDPLLRKLLLENAMLNQELADTKQCMMYYIRTMHSQIQEMNKKLLDRMLGIKQEPEETHKKRYCKWHYTITRSYEPVVVYV